jgi:hypothetical protein
MNGRKITIMMVLLAFVAASFLAGPVSSGEHPWDSDMSYPESFDEELWQLYLDSVNREAKDDGGKSDTTSTGGDQEGTPQESRGMPVETETQSFDWFGFFELYLQWLLIR